MWNSTSNIDFSRFCFDQSIRLEVVHIWSMRALCLYTHTHFFFSVSLDISILLYCKQTPQRPLKWLNVLKTIFNTFRIEINIWKLSDTDGRWNIISNCDTRKTDEQKKIMIFEKQTGWMRSNHNAIGETSSTRFQMNLPLFSALPLQTHSHHININFSIAF